jgi:hypothetical protein
MTDPIERNALNWQGIAIGHPSSHTYFDEGIEGLHPTGSDIESTPRSTGGDWGGASVPKARTIVADAWLGDPDEIPDADDETDWDTAALWRIADSMDNRWLPTDELPLAWSGLMWPAGEWCSFVRPVQCEWLTDEEGVHGGAPGLTLAWKPSAPHVYTLEQFTAALWSPDDPVSSAEFQALNPGRLREFAGRAWQLRMTAHGTLVSPWVRVDHPDGSFEKISFSGLTMTGGQVLKVEDVGLGVQATVNGRIKSGHIRSVTERGIVARAPRWWRLLPTTEIPAANTVAVGAAAGVFSGFMKTRGTR